MWGLGVLPVAVKVCGGREVCCECGFGCGASLHRFVEMMGEGKLWPAVRCFRAICLAPQLVCGCSTRAPVAFFLAWGGWRQRGGCAVLDRGRGRSIIMHLLYCFRTLITTNTPPHTEIRTQNHNKDMDLNIKGFDTNQHTVEVGADDTVEGLRRKVASAMGLPEDGFCMSFGDEALGEGADMTQLSAGDTIILTKMRNDVKTIELGELGHLVRERMFFVRLSSTKTDVNAKGGGRANLRGIRAGVDKEKTLALTKSKVLSDYEAGTLRHIVADGTLTGVRLARAKLRETATCPYCAAGVDEDPKHMWWECVAWESIRTDYPLLLNIDRTNWPNCLSICGMCTPETPLATARVADLQMMMVRILIERYRQNRTQEMKPQLEQERYPWTWEPDADTTTQYPNVLGSCTLPVKKWPYGRALLLAIAYWLGGLRWSNEAGREVSHMELLIDFEVSTGMDIRPGDKTGKKPPKVKQPGNGAGGVVNGGGGGDGEMDDGGGEGGSDDGDGDDVMPEALPHNEMAKATTFGHMLSTLRTHAATPLHPGKPKIAMTLTSFGAHGLAGIDCRPVFAGGEETIRVLRALFDAGTAYRQQRKTEGMTEGEIRGNGRARGTWMGEYAAETAYPPADERGRRALRFFEQAEEENVPIRYRHDEHVKPGDAPVKAPAGAISIGPFAICVQHRKARCDACAKDQMADLRHCCYAHHSDGDGLAIRHEACTRHRLSRCGNCVRDKTTLDHCCRRHHDTAGGRQTTLGGLFSKKKQKDGHSRGGDGLM